MTDPRSTKSPSSDSSYLLRGESTDVTSGSAAAALRSSRLTEDARALLPRIPNGTVARTANDLLSIIEDVVYAMETAGSDMDALPPIRATLSEAGSLLLEWTTADFRLGFNIEPAPEESGWYLATSKRLGVGTQGFLSKMNKQALIALVLEFVRANS